MVVVGETILHYELLEKLGEGGAGTVYRAQDTRLGRLVALKFLSARYAKDSRAKERFMREAQAAARLDHPNIGVTHSIEEDRDKFFIVMAHYEGQTLATRLETGALNVIDAISFASQTAKGLAKAHEEGIVHRDIKPANLMITRDRLIKILDFGIAKFDGISGLTQAGGFLGTLAYMSPEQMRGQTIDHRVDVWALGVVLYEMLAGETPFANADNFSALLLNILSHDPTPLSDVRADLPADIDQVINKALAKEPQERYASVQAFAEDLLALQHGSTPTARYEPPAKLVTAERHARDERASNNIPRQTAALIGRQDELAVINLHLDHPQCRVLTIFGQGGIGKTRLALEVASEQVELGVFDGVYYVPLDDARSGDDLIQALASALDLPSSETRFEAISRHIADQRLLLILDNFEHLMDEAMLPADLISTCSALKVMIVSRERLNIAEEWVVPLLGLPLPAYESNIEQALASGAVQLFVQRARRAKLSFNLNKDELPAVISICHRLQGSPLALELAAVWVKMMSCDDIAREIEQDLDFLATSARNVTKRHRSIRTVFEYSWRLLDTSETDALAKLAVFKRGFRKEAAQAVAGASLPVLISLVDKSLLQVSDDWRYEWHSLLYQYAEEKLAENATIETDTRHKHSRYYLAQLHEHGVRGSEHLRALAEEKDNLAAAWYWAIAQQDETHIADNAKLLALLLMRINGAALALELLNIAIRDFAAADTCAPLQLAYGHVLERCGRLQDAQKAAKQALQLYKNQPSTAPGNADSAQIDALLLLARCWMRVGNTDDARGLLEQARDMASTSVSRKLADVLSNLGRVLLLTGDVSDAEAHFQRALELLQDSGDDYQAAAVLADLGILHLRYAAPQQAKASLEVAADLAKRIFDRPRYIDIQARLAHTAFVLAEYDHAEASAKSALENLADAPLLDVRSDLEALLARVNLVEGDLPAAQRHIKCAIDLAWQAGANAQVLEHLVTIAELHVNQARLDHAATLLHTVLASSQTHYLDKRRAWRVLENVSEYLDVTALRNAEAEGQHANLETLVEYILQGS
jgi:predicted ATPase